MQDELLDGLYLNAKAKYSEILRLFNALLLRFRKFLALPYCFIKFVDWGQCKLSKFRVCKDFLYIFFKLKYYPENYGYCRLWEKDKNEWKYYYGSNYDAYQNFKLEKEVQKKEYKIIFDDKEVCQQVCEASGINIPKCVGILAPGYDYRERIEHFFEISDCNRLIIKPVRGHGGQGILIAARQNNGFKIFDTKKVIDIQEITLKERCVVQEYISQSKELSELTNSASIRIITFYTKSDDILLISGEILTAVESHYLSNWSAGGVTVSVDIDTGRLFDVGYDKYGNKYIYHPSTNIQFKDFTIPRWEEIKEFAAKIQKSFPYFRMLGPDITLTEKGPILYEINASPDLSSTEQSCGPLLKNKRILEEFNNYDLLISKYQKMLLKRP